MGLFKILHSKIMRRAEFDVTEAHREICDLAAGKINWQMSIPVQPDDSDMILQRPLDHIEKLLPLIEALANCAKALELCQKAIASGYSPHQDAGQVVYDTARTESTIALSSLAGIVGDG